MQQSVSKNSDNLECISSSKDDFLRRSSVFSSKLQGDIAEIENSNTNEMNNTNSDWIYTSNCDILIDGQTRTLKQGDFIFEGKIRITEILGEGGQASVYKGILTMEDEEMEVAVKMYTFDSNEDEDNPKVAEILSICKNLTNIQHKNVVEFYSYMFEKTETYNRILIIMECLDMNLNNYLCSQTTIQMSKIVSILCNILNGLNHLHKNKIIHRDLKPENILVKADLSQIKIVDFGICDEVQENKTIIKRNDIGTEIYKSPEVTFGFPVAYDVDIWAIGCILFYLVTGEVPYQHVKMKGMIWRYSSPLETASDEALDFIYDKKNRMLLDFLQQCWRGNNKFRPGVEELINHPFIKENSRHIINP